jgi:hypothetical protein
VLGLLCQLLDCPFKRMHTLDWTMQLGLLQVSPRFR